MDLRYTIKNNLAPNDPNESSPGDIQFAQNL